MFIDNYVPKKLDAQLTAEIKQKHHNWSYMARYIASSNDDPFVVGSLIRYEVDGERRPDVMLRLSARLSSIIGQMVKTEIYTLCQEKLS